MHALTRQVVDCRQRSNVPMRLQMAGQAFKGVGEVSLHFQLELNTLGSLSAPPPPHTHTHHTHIKI
jgi:hypothetical protein